MDFEDAARRLARDQSKLKGRTTGKNLAMSEKAKRQAEYQKRQQERLRQEREKRKRLEQYQQQYMRQGARALHTKALGSPLVEVAAAAGAAGGGGHHSKPLVTSNGSTRNGNGNGGRQDLLLSPTSIWGEGDKVALPPSVLETLTAAMSDESNDGTGNPWTFRIGIVNPQYSFPASPLLQALTPPADNDTMEEDIDKGDDDDEEDDKMTAYLDELSLKYIAYTHCTVVEFTQEEGFVGIPQPIASALLDPENRHVLLRDVNVATTRTVDPAGAAATAAATKDEVEDEGEEAAMNIDTGEEGDKTPGHLAWGAFDIPNVPLEITLVRLPKGRGATLVPTPEAVRRNFYGLKDVKLVLEQSLIRTRATLSQGDVVSTWHRGVKFDLNVTKLIPTTFHAVTCINTDIEVEIGETSANEDNATTTSPLPPPEPKEEESQGFRLGSGGSRSLSSSVTPTPMNSNVSSTNLPPSVSNSSKQIIVELLPEPAMDQKEGVCTVQIRYSGGQGKRRFAVDTAKLKDLFAFASSLMKRSPTTFRLVTRFPRREWSLLDEGGMEGTTGSLTMAEAGIQQGQELFLCEDL